MSQVSDNDIHNIVDKVVRQIIGGDSPIQPNIPAQPIKISVPDQVEKTPMDKPTQKVVAIGTDHGGVDLKAILIKELNESGFTVIDCGTDTKDPVDYPDIALSVAKLVANGSAWRGVVIDGAGIGSCMAANKVPGIRAAMCYDYSSAVNSREHNDANVLTLGAGLIGVNLAKQILKTWLNTEFGGGRHAGRVDKIISIEKTYLKDGKA